MLKTLVNFFIGLSFVNKVIVLNDKEDIIRGLSESITSRVARMLVSQVLPESHIIEIDRKCKIIIDIAKEYDISADRLYELLVSERDITGLGQLEHIEKHYITSRPMDVNKCFEMVMKAICRDIADGSYVNLYDYYIITLDYRYV